MERVQVKNKPVETNQSQILADARAALDSTDRNLLADSVRSSLKWFAAQHPGRAVELRVPPFLVVQVLGGTTHRRGTPPAVVEMAPEIWLGLLTGNRDWVDEIATGAITASGERSDLSQYFPLSD